MKKDIDYMHELLIPKTKCKLYFDVDIKHDLVDDKNDA